MINNFKKFELVAQQLAKKYITVRIGNIDNPGWVFVLQTQQDSIKTHLRVAELPLIQRELEDDWISASYSKKDHTEYNIYGGSYNLIEMFNYFFEILKIDNTPEIVDPQIQYLQQWFQEQCNGDWEHCYGIIIEFKQGRWLVDISIYDTYLELIKTPLDIYNNNYQCYFTDSNNTKITLDDMKKNSDKSIKPYGFVGKANIGYLSDIIDKFITLDKSNKQLKSLMDYS
jgi:hypothetical protein